MQTELLKEKKYYVLSSTEGCATNLQETSAYRADYEARGLRAADRPEQADIILVNTCAYSQSMEDRATDMISKFREKYPQAEIVVGGCLPKINPKKMRNEFTGVAIRSMADLREDIASNQFDRRDFEFLSEKHRLVLTLRPIYFAIEKFFGFRFHPLHNLFKTVVVNEDFQLVTVSTGCLGKCTFCAIKRAKGSLRSRPMPTILSEVDLGLQRKKKLFWLLGDDIGCWGLDIDSNIANLLAEIVRKPDDFEVVLNYFDPHYFKNNREMLIEAISNRKIIGLNIPIQSGSQRILDKMQRYYNLEDVFETLQQIKNRNNKVAIKTNIIVGFPGESWGDFFASLKSIVHFDAVLALKFTARPNTPAAQFNNQISEPVKQVRMAIMNTFIFFRHAYVAIKAVTRFSVGAA